MRVCFWATSFQSDIQTVAYDLAENPQFEVVVAMDNPEAYRQDAIWRVRPFPGRLIDRRQPDIKKVLTAFKADVMVVDNHLPSFTVAPRIMVLWHGYGWRKDDISGMRKALRKHVGKVTVANPRFTWQAFGPDDRRFTIDHRRIHEDNVVALGSPYSDLLLPDSGFRSRFDKRTVADCFNVDIVGRKTVLIGMTWHYGGLLGGFGDELDLLAELLEHISQREANVVFRMHDRHRYAPDYLAAIEALVSKRSGVMLKFKSESPDSLVDILVSDVLITNFSSFANLYYYTHKPCLHIHPFSSPAQSLVLRKFTRGKVQEKRIASSDDIFKMSPEDNGGLLAHTFGDLLDHIDTALDTPSVVAAAARSFIERHITAADGRTCARVGSALLDW